MAITAETQSSAAHAMMSEPRSGSLADVVDVILDKGIVIDAFVRVSLVGIEILTIDARIVVASVETYMHFAREAHRLEMGGGGGSAKQGLAGMMGKLAAGGAHDVTRGALKGAGEGLREGLFPHRRKSGEDKGGGIVQRAVGAIRGALSPGEDSDDEQASAAEPQSQGRLPANEAPRSEEPRDERSRVAPQDEDAAPAASHQANGSQAPQPPDEDAEASMSAETTEDEEFQDRQPLNEDAEASPSAENMEDGEAQDQQPPNEDAEASTSAEHAEDDEIRASQPANEDAEAAPMKAETPADGGEQPRSRPRKSAPPRRQQTRDAGSSRRAAPASRRAPSREPKAT